MSTSTRNNNYDSTSYSDRRSNRPTNYFQPRKNSRALWQISKLFEFLVLFLMIFYISQDTDSNLKIGDRHIADLRGVCIFVLGVAASNLIVPPIIAALADFFAANMNLGDKSLAYVLAVLVQQRWSGARIILGLTGLFIYSILALIIGARFNHERPQYEPIDINKVEANSLGGRFGERYGMTSMSLILNASKSHWPMGTKTHGYYQGESKSDNTVHTLVPKIPEIGMYLKETEHHLTEPESVTKATVHDLHGVSYDCKYSVGGKISSWKDVSVKDNMADAENLLKVSKNEVKLCENKQCSHFFFRLAFNRFGPSYIELDMTCKIELVLGELNMSTESDGLVLIDYLNTSYAPFDQKAPRLIGKTRTELGVHLAYAAGYSSSVQWRKQSTSERKWRGLVSAICAAHALRLAQGQSIIDTDKEYKISNAESRHMVYSKGAKWPMFLLLPIYLFANFYFYFSDRRNLIRGSASQLGSLLGNIAGNDLGESELRKTFAFQLNRLENNEVQWRVVGAESFTRSSDSLFRNTSEWLDKGNFTGALELSGEIIS